MSLDIGTGFYSGDLKGHRVSNIHSLPHKVSSYIRPNLKSLQATGIFLE
jgi:hypothetical protein